MSRTAKKPKVKVYRRHDGLRAEVGPPGAFKVGDRLTVPARGPWLGDAGCKAFEAEITDVQGDGVAIALHITSQETRS